MAHIDALLLTKAQRWAYEREWRIIDHDNGSGERAFHPPALCEVILGAKMNPDDRATVTSWLEGRGYPVSLFQARQVVGSYALVIEAVALTASSSRTAPQ